MEISDIIRSFESRTKNKKQRYKEFCAHCWYVYDKQIKSTKSKKMINKYINDKESLIKYIISNKKAITSELSK